MARSNVTLKAIAEAVGCSPMVVSVVLNPNGSTVRVSESTRERVLMTAANLGYRRNELARAVATGKTRVIGLLAPTFESEMQIQILMGAQEIASEHGYLIKLLRIPREAEKVRDVIAQCASQMLSGVIGISISDTARELLEKEARAHEIPVALLVEAPEQDWAWRISSYDESGIREAVDHLLARGHRHFALLSGPPDSPMANQRQATFRRVFAEKGINLPEEATAEGDWWYPEINQPLIARLLQAIPRPTALLCASDWGAMAGLREARALGFHIPKDLSVIGFGDHKFAHFADPALSSIHQPFFEMGCLAMNTVMGAVTGSPTAETPRSVELPTHLLTRNSTGPAPELSTFVEK